MPERVRSATLQQVVQAQVAFLFGRFRPVGGLSAEEQKAISAERVEFAARVLAYVRNLPAPVDSIMDRVREVARIYNADQRLEKMPTPEQIAALVKEAFTEKNRAGDCAGCADLGGYYPHAGKDAPLRPKMPGVHPWPGGRWLCNFHHLAAYWYAYREQRKRDRLAVVLSPPESLLPENFLATKPDRRPVFEHLLEGPQKSRTARWAIAYVEAVYGITIAEEYPLGPVHVRSEPREVEDPDDV